MTRITLKFTTNKASFFDNVYWECERSDERLTLHILLCYVSFRSMPVCTNQTNRS